MEAFKYTNVPYKKLFKPIMLKFFITKNIKINNYFELLQK